MKITTQQQLDKLIATANESNTIVLKEDLEITFNCEIPCNINTIDINANSIIAHDIKAHDISALNINARNINARDLDAIDIHAYNINARNIEYYAFCIASQSLRCESIAGERENSLHKCLDKEIEIIQEEKKVSIELTQEQLDKIKHLI
jgi:hypothetical protein